jgi:hypothetical protein
MEGEMLPATWGRSSAYDGKLQQAEDGSPPRGYLVTMRTSDRGAKECPRNLADSPLVDSTPPRFKTPVSYMTGVEDELHERKLILASGGEKDVY